MQILMRDYTFLFLKTQWFRALHLPFSHSRKTFNLNSRVYVRLTPTLLVGSSWVKNGVHPK